MLVSRIVHVLPFLGILAAGWLGWLFGSGRRVCRWAGAAITTAVCAQTLVMSLLIDQFFLTDNVRRDASRWIETHVPEGVHVGFIHHIGPYWYSPDIIYMDYYHPERTGQRYAYREYAYQMDMLREEPSEYLVLAQHQLDQLKGSDMARFEELNDILSSSYQPVAEFQPSVRIGPFARHTFHPHLFVSGVVVWRYTGNSQSS